jgi:hypothetical protein
MPNFQQWLNAWVKVNTKQGHGDQGVSRSQSPRTRLRQPNKSLSQPSGYQQSSSATQVRAEKRSNHEFVDVSASQYEDNNNNNIPKSSFSSEDLTLSTSTGPLAVTSNPHANKSGSRKQRPRLYRTNSPSDLIREQVLIREQERRRSATATSGHSSGQQPHTERSGEVFPSREPRRPSNAFDQRRPRAKQQRHRQPPPTLHHSMDDAGFESSDSSSTTSAGPTPTATTAHGQHRHRDNNNDSHRMATEGADDIDSNEVLLNVADFFGTEIRELRARPSGSRHHTHKGQHGVEDEQPHYLRPFMNQLTATANNNNNTNKIKPNNNNNMKANNRNHSPPPPTYSYNRPIYNKNEDTRPNSHHRRSRSLHDTAQATQLFDERQETRTFNPRPLASRPKNAKSASISFLPKGGAREAAIRPTESTAIGLVVGGVRLPFFPQNVTSASVTTEATESNATAIDNNNRTEVGKPENCVGCKTVQAELRHAYDSLEYMRTMAIRKEFTCHKCGTVGEAADASIVALNGNTQGSKKPTVLRNASEQLLEVTGRHKKQVEQLMKDRVSSVAASCLLEFRKGTLCRLTNSLIMFL